ncbi:TPA: branched-chain amino acid ABC transporter permease, partial [Candidatus Micrarchaeota archaeon]|nr:branched-chain amino acid ABC transporter permease [Candidatus Micrarchaeota archaeon]
SLVFASMFFLIASGLSLIFGVMRILNIAHGALYMIGAYIAYTLITEVRGLHPLVAYLMIPLTGLVVGCIGLATERFLIRYIYGREEVYQLLLTFGLALVFDDIVRIFWGLEPRSASEPYARLGVVELGSVAYPTYNFVVMGAAAVSGLILWYLLFKTRVGRVIRATANNRELAQAMGVRVGKLYTLTFGLGATLVGAGGAVMLPATSATPGMGTDVIVEAFAVVAIGGLGSIKGAAVGSLIIGFLRTLGITFFPEVELAVLYLITAGVLLVRPRGLFG